MQHAGCAVTGCLTVDILHSDWERLRQECSTYKDSHYAEATKKVRSVQVKAYLEFCKIFEDRVQPYPCDADQTCMYMSYLARRLCFSSIRQYLSGLNNHLKELGCDPIDYKDFKVKACMTGIRRSLGDAPRQAPPLLPINLLVIFEGLCDTPGHTAMRAAMLLSFRALLRKAHVTESESALLRKDFAFHGWGMLVKIRRSKTIQFKERTHLIPVSYVRERALCAVYWVRRHFDQLRAGDNKMAFRLPKGRGSVAMPYSYYLEALKILCTRAGMQPALFTTHSLRRGGATFLRMCGASIAEIKERGDWRSDAVYEYLKASLSERLSTDIRVAVILGTL